MEQVQKTDTLSARYVQLTDCEPKLVTNYVPGNAAEQKAAFLMGDIHIPNHEYGKLAAIDFPNCYHELDIAGTALLESVDMDPKFVSVYQEFIADYIKKTRLMELATQYKQADSQTEKIIIGSDYMTLNRELYGEPDEVTYRSLLAEKLHQIHESQLDGRAAILRTELFALVDYDETAEIPERFLPSCETVAWMHDITKILYGAMLAHVPEQDIFTVQELKAVFMEIIEQEFSDAAAGWRVDVEPANSINVKSAEKRIVIPENRADMGRSTVNGLVVHEIGVHMLRAITGAETDLKPLQNGLNGYYNTEEGLGVVMDQALMGKFNESGVDHYLTAGLAYFDKKDFRDIYEVKWRLETLAKAIGENDINEATIKEAQNSAYNSTLRSLRGTDELPWFKDLAYYNGSMEMWRHLEDIRGDDLRFMFVLMGKANPNNIHHRRIMYETKTVERQS